AGSARYSVGRGSGGPRLPPASDRVGDLRVPSRVETRESYGSRPCSRWAVGGSFFNRRRAPAEAVRTERQKEQSGRGDANVSHPSKRYRGCIRKGSGCAEHFRFAALLSGLARSLAAPDCTLVLQKASLTHLPSQP